jgi:Cu2+-exporting ATPase
MTAVMRPQASACPACSAAPAAEALAQAVEPTEAHIVLSLPTIHCAACMATVERALEGAPGVRTARVNLTMKRVSIDADPEQTAADMIPVVEAAG